MKVILAKNGEKILVDDEDFPLLSRHKWIVHSNGYARTIQNHKYWFMHRIVFPVKGDLYVDHINHNKLDNRKENLREVTNSQNQMNRKTSKTAGVSFHKVARKWRARITKNQKEIHLGLFKNKQEAVRARQEAFKNWESL